MVIHTDGIRTVSNAPPPRKRHCQGCGDPYAILVRDGHCATCDTLGPLYDLADYGRSKMSSDEIHDSGGE